jgi:hypothetical protein
MIKNKFLIYLLVSIPMIIPLIFLDGRDVLVFSIGIMFIMTSASFFAKSFLFPGIDLQKLYEEALKTPLSASIVFMAICVFLSFLVLSSILLLR